jgi:hypothetical protein
MTVPQSGQRISKDANSAHVPDTRTVTAGFFFGRFAITPSRFSARN